MALGCKKNGNIELYAERHAECVFLKRVKNVCVCNAYDDERRNKYFIALLILAPLTVLYLQMLDTYRHACSYISLEKKKTTNVTCRLVSVACSVCFFSLYLHLLQFAS